MDCEQARADSHTVEAAVKVAAGMVAFVDAEHPRWYWQATHDGGALPPDDKATPDRAWDVMQRRGWAMHDRAG